MQSWPLRSLKVLSSPLSVLQGYSNEGYSSLRLSFTNLAKNITSLHLLTSTMLLAVVPGMYWFGGLIIET